MNNRKKIQQGITLIEMAVALMLVAVIVAGVMTWMSGINQQLQLRSDVKHFSRVAKAAELYLNSERGELIKEYNRGVREKVIPASELYSKGYLPKDVQTTLGKKYQQIVMLIKLGSGNESESRGLLMSTGGVGSNPTYTDYELGTMANMSEFSIGFVANGSSVIQGVNGSWKTTLSEWSFPSTPVIGISPKPTPGHLVALLDSSDSRPRPSTPLPPSPPSPPVYLCFKTFFSDFYNGWYFENKINNRIFSNDTGFPIYLNLAIQSNVKGDTEVVEVYVNDSFAGRSGSSNLPKNIALDNTISVVILPGDTYTVSYTSSNYMVNMMGGLHWLERRVSPDINTWPEYLIWNAKSCK